MSSITFDNAAALSGKFSAGATNPQNFLVGSGSNRVLFVVAGLQYSSSPQFLTSVTFGGVNLTNVVRTSDGSHLINEVWMLVNPTSGIGAIVLHYAGAPTIMGWGAASFAGEDQGNPWASNAAGTGSIGTNISGPVISGGDYGFGTTTLAYTNTAEGPPSAPTVFTNLRFSAGMGAGGGTFAAGNFVNFFDGPYNGGSSTLSQTSNDGSGGNYVVQAVSLNGFPVAIRDPIYFNSDPSAVFASEACEYAG